MTDGGGEVHLSEERDGREGRRVGPGEIEVKSRSEDRGEKLGKASSGDKDKFKSSTIGVSRIRSSKTAMADFRYRFT